MYRASQDGFHSSKFHSKCDGKGNTLTILKANGFIFGGFTSIAWDVSGQWKSDPNAFLFSLTNKDEKPCKMNIKNNRHQKAIHCGSMYGPIFGEGCDIYIASNSNTTNGSYSILGFTYTHPEYAFDTNEARSFLAGSLYFQVSEFEVYQIE